MIHHRGMEDTEKDGNLLFRLCRKQKKGFTLRETKGMGLLGYKIRNSKNEIRNKYE